MQHKWQGDFSTLLFLFFCLLKLCSLASAGTFLQHFFRMREQCRAVSLPAVAWSQLHHTDCSFRLCQQGFASILALTHIGSVMQNSAPSMPLLHGFLDCIEFSSSLGVERGAGKRKVSGISPRISTTQIHVSSQYIKETGNINHTTECQNKQPESKENDTPRDEHFSQTNVKLPQVPQPRS